MSTTQPRMKGKPSLDEFRTGGGDVAAEGPAGVPSVAAPEPAAAPPQAAAPLTTSAPASVQLSSEVDARTRENKTIRLRKSFVKRLKADAFHRSNAEGRRVTESDIIDEALEQYFRARASA